MATKVHDVQSPPKGASILNSIADCIRSEIFLSDHQLVAVVLFAAHTYAIEAAMHSPRLHINSPTYGCGKTELALCLSRIVRSPEFLSNVTEAVIFRLIAQNSPTLVLDEEETHLRQHRIRGILNSGYQFDGTVGRVDAKTGTVVKYRTFTPTVICGIGEQHETLASRCIRIMMRRPPVGSGFEQRRKKSTESLIALRTELAEWVTAHLTELKNSQPEMPQPLVGRNSDNWRSFFALADLAGGDWPKRARDSAVALCAEAKLQDEHPVIQLMKAAVFYCTAQNIDRIRSVELSTHLNLIEDRAWESISKGIMTPTSLARLLRPFSIHPITTRSGQHTWKGYKKEMFERALESYADKS